MKFYSRPEPGIPWSPHQCEIIYMVKTLNGAVSAISQDTSRIQRAYQQLCAENVARDNALADLTAMVREYSSSPVTTRSHPTIQADVLDEDRNLCAADIGITWEGNETFLHGVRVVGSNFPRPIMSTPYPQRRDSGRDNTSTTAQPPTPVPPVTTMDADARIHRFSLETRQGYRPAAPIQRFNNKSLNWPAWFRHFRAVADVHGWTNEQRALQLVSYLDETTMNVAQELGDSELYNCDVLVKLLSDRFDLASRVSAFRSRFHSAITMKMLTCLRTLLQSYASGVPAESTGAEAGVDCRAVCQRSIRPRTEEVSLGGNPDPEG